MNNKLKLLICMLLFAFGSQSCGNAQTKHPNVVLKMNPDAPKNYYAMSFSSNGCNFRILINDIPVVEYFKEGAQTGMMPINDNILKSGKQRLKVELYPVKNHEEKGINSTRPLDIYIKCKKQGEGLSDYETILANPVPSDIKMGIPYFEYETEFDAKVPYELRGWSDCVDLRKVPDIEKKVLAKYEEIRTILNKKQYDKFNEMYDFKQAHIDSAIYRSHEIGLKEMDEDCAEYARKYDEAPPLENYKLLFYGDGRLAFLENTQDHNCALALMNEVYMQPILFYLGMRKGSDELEIIL